MFANMYGSYCFVVDSSWMYSGLPLTVFKVKVLRSVPEIPLTFRRILFAVSSLELWPAYLCLYEK